METDKEHMHRALMATRFMDTDAHELAQMLATDAEKARAAVAAYRRTRDRFATLAAGCELAACLVKEALGD